jgi:hypothetical protein
MDYVEEHFKRYAELCKPRSDSSTERDTDPTKAEQKVSDEHKATPIDQIRGF